MIPNLSSLRQHVAKGRICRGGQTLEGRDELLEIIDRHLRGESTRVEFQNELSISTVDSLLREGVVPALFSRRLFTAFLEWRCTTSGGGQPEKTADVKAGAEDFHRWYERERERVFEVLGLARKMLELREFARARHLVERLELLTKAYRELELAWWPVDFAEHGRRWPNKVLPEWLENEKARLDTALIRASGGREDELPF